MNSTKCRQRRENHNVPPLRLDCKTCCTGEPRSKLLEGLLKSDDLAPTLLQHRRPSHEGPGFWEGFQPAKEPNVSLSPSKSRPRAGEGPRSEDVRIRVVAWKAWIQAGTTKMCQGIYLAHDDKSFQGQKGVERPNIEHENT